MSKIKINRFVSFLFISFHIALFPQQPLRNEELIKDRHNIVECLVDASTTRADLYEDHLKRLPDILVGYIR